MSDKCTRKIHSAVSQKEIARREEDSRYLKYGDIISISKAVGCSRQNVTSFIKGYNNSKRVSKAFDEFVKERKRSFAQGIKENLK